MISRASRTSTRPDSRSRDTKPSRAGSTRLLKLATTVALNFDAGGSLDEEVCQNEVVAWEDLASVDSIVIEDPPGEKQCGPLIAFDEALSRRDSIRHNRSSDNRIVFVVN